MARTLTDNFLKKLTAGDFNKIRECVIADPELSLEIRQSSIAMVYYKKSKILSLHSRKKQPVLLAQGYWRGKSEPTIDIYIPEPYFIQAKELVNAFAGKKKNIEFSIQQKILADNNSCENQYLVVDMEYQFAQKAITERTKQKTRFDLVAIDLINKEIVLFELKQGFASSDGNSGVIDHLNRFSEHEKHTEFKKSVYVDLQGLIKQKELLGIFKFNTSGIISELGKNLPVVFKTIFAYETIAEKSKYQSKYGANSDTLYLETTLSTYIIK